MPFPDSPRVVFETNPIAEAICQLRFPTILEITASPPSDFQKHVRSEYPIYETAETGGMPKEVAMMLARIPGMGRHPEQVVNRFLTQDRARTVSLSSDFLAISETDYVEWPTFRSHIEEARRVLEEIYGPAWYERIGLRYVNRISLDELGLAGSNWRDLLNPVFVGMLGSSDVAPNVLSLVTQASIDLSSVIPGARVTVRYALQPDEDGEKFVLDSDFYVAERRGATDVAEIINAFNTLNGNLFRWVVPRDGPLWRALRPRPVAS